MSKLISKIVVPDSNEATGYSLYNVKDSGAIHSSDVGVAGGVASLDNTGKVPSSQLPSYVDDVVEGYYHENKFYTTYTPGQEEEDPGTYSGEITAETGKIYVDISTNQSYRWSGSAYIVISSSYVLPIASANTLGGVKVGDNLSIDQNGVLSAQASSGAKTNEENGNGIGTCSTSSGTALTVSLTGYELVKNGFVAVTFENDVPANATLNINSKGAKPIYYKGSAITADTIKADDTVMFCYNGSQYVVTSLGAGGASPVNPTETVIISLTQIGGDSADLIGASITITDDDSSETILTATWDGFTIITDIPMGTYYTVSVETIEGYLACADKSYLAGYQTTRNITFQYRAQNGVFIEATDGTLYTSSTWASSGKEVNSIVILTSNCKMRIAPIATVKKPCHSNYTDPIENYLSKEAEPKSNYNGTGNTNNIIQFNKVYNTNTTSYAAPYCRNYVFAYPNQKKGDLPTLGQLYTIHNNITNVNSCLSVCGITQIDDNTYYMASSYYGLYLTNKRELWSLKLISGSQNFFDIANTIIGVLVVADYE